MPKAKIKTTKKAAAKGRSRAMANDDRAELEQNDEDLQHNGDQADDASKYGRSADREPLPPHPVSPQGSQAPRDPGAPAPLPERSFDQDEQFLLLLAAIMYVKANAGSVKDAYQQAKNLCQLLVDEQEASLAEPGAEGNHDRQNA